MATISQQLVQNIISTMHSPPSTTLPPPPLSPLHHSPPSTTVPPQHPPRSRPTSVSPYKRLSVKDNMALCRVMLRELDRQDDAWPFLEPVGKRKFPEYFKVVKQPMDFQTMRNKLKEGK